MGRTSGAMTGQRGTRRSTSTVCSDASNRPTAQIRALSAPSYARLTLERLPFRPGRTTGAGARQTDDRAHSPRCSGHVPGAFGGRGGARTRRGGRARASRAIAPAARAHSRIECTCARVRRVPRVVAMGPGWSGPTMWWSRAMLGPKRALGSRIYTVCICSCPVRHGDRAKAID